MFSEDVALLKNGSAECSIKTVFTMASNIMVNAALRFTEENFSTYIR